MSQNIEPPKSFFDVSEDDTFPDETNHVENVKPNEEVVKVVEKPKKKKFSMSKFKTKKQNVNTEPEDIVTNETLDELVYTSREPRKSMYLPSKTIPTILAKYKKNQNYELTMSQNVKSDKERVRMRKLQEKSDAENTMSLFGDAAVEPVIEDEEEEVDSEAVNSAIDIMNSGDVYSKKDKNTLKTAIPISTYMNQIHTIFMSINPEERGMIILNMIFGGLISRNKLSGMGGKAGSSQFPKLVTGINLLKMSKSSDSLGKIYTSVINSILSNNLNKYRNSTSANDQVTNIVKFIKTLKDDKVTVFFPNNVTLNDPFPIKDTNVQVASIRGTPTLDNITNFFAPPVKEVDTKKSNKGKFVSDSDANFDVQEQLTRGYQKNKQW